MKEEKAIKPTIEPIPQGISKSLLDYIDAREQEKFWLEVIDIIGEHGEDLGTSVPILKKTFRLEKC